MDGGHGGSCPGLLTSDTETGRARELQHRGRSYLTYDDLAHQQQWPKFQAVTNQMSNDSLSGLGGMRVGSERSLGRGWRNGWEVEQKFLSSRGYRRCSHEEREEPPYLPQTYHLSVL